MGQGEEVKTRSEPQLEIQERGEIFFFYRPKVGKEEVRGPQDVQRLYVVLRPESGEHPLEQKQDPHSGKEGAGTSPSSSSPRSQADSGGGGHGTQEVNIEKEALLRMIVMGRKSLPDPSKRSQPYWGFVELVTTNIDLLKDALGPQEYETNTRGHRHLDPARAVGEGVYRILRHNPGKRMHTHLVYKLELPVEDEQNEPQESLNIERQASFLIQIKNPHATTTSDSSGSGSGFRGLGNKRKATFPAHLEGLFGKKRFGPADPPDFLNYEGCELLLISASDDIEEELGLEVKTESCEADDPSCSDLVKTFGEALPTKPLLQGAWV
ncbi:hypothetical protein M5689_018332 [Euphorbia peplus]|nr:hypothetical protein M5689_018332 [Euphorbia peplus]